MSDPHSPEVEMPFVDPLAAGIKPDDWIKQEEALAAYIWYLAEILGLKDWRFQVCISREHHDWKGLNETVYGKKRSVITFNYLYLDDRSSIRDIPFTNSYTATCTSCGNRSVKI